MSHFRIPPNAACLMIATAIVASRPLPLAAQPPANPMTKSGTKSVAATPEESLDQIIAALKSGDQSFGNLYAPLGKLTKLPIDPKRRDEVSALLDPLVLVDNTSVRRAAQSAIQAWGTNKNEPTLLKLLEWQGREDRHAGMEALAALGGSKESAEAIAKLLPKSEDRSYAQRALEKMGSFAEEAVWEHIGSADNQVHTAACHILGKVGSSKSLVKLRARRKDRDSSRHAAIEVAIREMEKRLIKR